MNATTTLTQLFEWLLNRSWQAGVLVLCVLLVQWLGRRWLTYRWRFALWWIVLVRLVLPFGPASELSLFNCFRFQSASSFAKATEDRPSFGIHQSTAAAPAAAGAPLNDSGPQKLSQSISPSQPEGVSLNAPAANGVLTIAGVESLPVTTVENASRGFKPGISEVVFAVAVGSWLVGMILLSALVVMQVFGLTRRLTRTAVRPDAHACEILRDCCRELRIRPNIELLETDAVCSPALFGLFRLRLLLPRGLATGFERSELRYIFLHELAHVRRGDLWINCLVTVLQILHWFNPLIWLGFSRMRADRELACDEMALQHTGETEAEAYGMTIIKLLKGINQPAAMPGLVGILEDRNQMRRRISRIAGFKKATRWSALAVLLLPGLGLVALTDAQPDRTPHPDLTGIVETTDGEPVQGTVFIYTAGPKAGTSTFCPSCYVDCRKSAKADEYGNFTIKSLDPQLIFHVLAAAPGYKPKIVSDVDPAKGPITIQLAPIELAAAPPGNCLHGRVVDTKGKPISGAVVDMHGIRGFNGMGEFGQLSGIDPMAVTDDKGEFLITSLKPFDLMDVQVSARGFADKNFIKLASGSETHELTLTEGASITGRVLLNGKPMASVDVVVVTEDRGTENTWAHFDVGTDSDGRFLLVNLPPDMNYVICGAMKSLAPVGAISTRTVRAGDDGSTTDVGDLTVMPGYRLAGRVVLADGKPVPAKTRLLIGRDNTWDSLQISLPSDGRFDVSNVPVSETYSLSVRVPGYHVSPKNRSYDTLNPGRLVGRVNEDTTNLTILLERGKTPTSQEFSDDQSEWPQNLPLEGVGGNQQVDHSQDWVLSGHVTDAQTGEPLKQFSATPGEENSWGRTAWEARDEASGTDGVYTVYMEKRWGQPVIKIEAEGYLPASVNVTPLEQTNADFALHAGTGPSGTVRGPDGPPVANADVLLLCSDVQNPDLNYDGHLRPGFPHQDGVLVKTGADGHFAFEPRLGMQSVAAASSDGFGRVSVSCLATNPDIILQPYGCIQGTLERPNGPGTNEDLDLAFVAPDSEGYLGIFYSAHTDSAGHFKFDRVPPGALEVSYRMPVGQNSWQNISLQEITVNPGRQLDLQIKAGARQVPDSTGFGGPPAPPVWIPGAVITGSVVLPDGRPAANAQVALQAKGQFMQLGKATIVSYEGWKNGLVVHTDPNGKFSLPDCEGAQTVIAVSDDGFARVSVDALKESPRVVLQPWGRIEGVFRMGKHPGVDQVVMMNDWQPMTGSNSVPPLFYDKAQTKTDAQGRFVLTYVPPGEHRINWMVPSGNRSFSGELLGSVEIKPGETKQVIFGGNGRTVIGKVEVAGENVPESWRQGRLFLRTFSKLGVESRKAKTQEQLIKLTQSASYQKEIANMRNYPAILSPDGSFRAEDVLPGKYELNLDFNLQIFRPGSTANPPTSYTYLFADRQFTVPKAAGTNDTLVDLGTINLKAITVPTIVQTNADSLKNRQIPIGVVVPKTAAIQ